MILHGSVENSRFPYKKRFHNKGSINLAKQVLKGFSPGVFNILCVTHSKSNKTDVKNLTVYGKDDIFLLELQQLIESECL